MGTDEMPHTTVRSLWNWHRLQLTRVERRVLLDYIVIRYSKNVYFSLTTNSVKQLNK